MLLVQDVIAELTILPACKALFFSSIPNLFKFVSISPSFLFPNGMRSFSSLFHLKKYVLPAIWLHLAFYLSDGRKWGGMGSSSLSDTTRSTPVHCCCCKVIQWRQSAHVNCISLQLSQWDRVASFCLYLLLKQSPQRYILFVKATC